MGKIECYVIEDLLPLYVEELCSPETRQEVEGHLEECVACREKLEQMKQGDEGAGFGEPVGIKDIRPFQKISRKMKRNRAVKVAALILLLIVCSVFGVLTAGQFYPDDYPSFDSILYRFQSKEIARKLVTGDEDDIREVLAGLGTVYGGSKLSENEQTILTNDTVAYLAENRTAFGEEDVSIYLDGVSYGGAEGPEQSDFYVAQLHIQSGEKMIYMDINFYNRNQYVISMWTEAEERDEGWGNFLKEGIEENSLEYQVYNIGMYLNYYLYSCYGERIENYVLNGRISAQNAETLRNNTFDGDWFGYYLREDCMKPGVEEEGADGTEYSQRTGERIYEILKRCQSNQFQMTDQQYNETEKKFNATLYWDITDLNGNTCNMTKSFYFGPFGYEPVDAAQTIRSDEGFDEELVKKMEGLFD